MASRGVDSVVDANADDGVRASATSRRAPPAASHEFEPREFIEAGDHVTVLGWEKSTALDTGKTFESEWVHVFTVQGGKITRWRGFFNTAARYGK
ncbi:MAG TPA: nuclear transport factor 2 family protein [Bryobacteraceae bacterium]